MVVGERKEDTERKRLNEGVECSRTANGIGHARAGNVRISLGKIKDLDEAEAKARRSKRWKEQSQSGYSLVSCSLKRFKPS